MSIVSNQSGLPPIDEAKIAEWKKTKIIGIIGMGDMGRLYASKFLEAGWKYVCFCNLYRIRVNKLLVYVHAIKSRDLPRLSKSLRVCLFRCFSFIFF